MGFPGGSDGEESGLSLYKDKKSCILTWIQVYY